MFHQTLTEVSIRLFGFFTEFNLSEAGLPSAAGGSWVYSISADIFAARSSISQLWILITLSMQRHDRKQKLTEQTVPMVAGHRA